MRQQYDLGVFIGRFQPFHLGHVSVINAALEHSKHVVVLVGSADEARSAYNPFTFQERKKMILNHFPNNVLVLPIYDYPYNNTKWITGVQDAVHEAIDFFNINNANIGLFGHSKDHTSYYLKMFPQWGSMEVPNYNDVSATPIREDFFAQKKIENIPQSTIDFLDEFYNSSIYKNLTDEFKYYREYRKQFENLKYPPIFTTVDAVVIQSGHVLMIERRSRPGKGLWALPGGFLNANEKIEDARIRELIEETKINVPELVLRGSIVCEKIFDNPHRSSRGRVITHAAMFKLKENTKFPKVKGADDAKRAKWIALSDIRRDQCFEDHAAIIETFMDYT